MEMTCATYIKLHVIKIVLSRRNQFTYLKVEMSFVRTFLKGMLGSELEQGEKDTPF